MTFKQVCRHLRYGKPILDLNKFDHEFPNASIRPIEDRDVGQCCRIYKANEQLGIPPQTSDKYESYLRKREASILAIEVENTVIGSGGVSIIQCTDTLFNISLSFGLVDPSQQGKGYGTLLLAARIAMLDPDKSLWPVTMTSAGNGSEMFYIKAGFVHIQKSEVEGYGLLDHYHVNVPSADVLHLRARLINSNISMNISFNEILPIVDMKSEYMRRLRSQQAALRNRLRDFRVGG